MSLFVYVTDACLQDAKRHGLAPDLHTLRDRVENSQRTDLFDPFPAGYLVKKKFGGRQGRLIAQHRSVGADAAIVFLSILIRGDHAYEDEFARDARAYGEQHFSHLATDDDLAHYVAERNRKPLPA